ncbi:MAG: methyltransferase [Planctomycetota bacterium]
MLNAQGHQGLLLFGGLIALVILGRIQEILRSRRALAELSPRARAFDEPGTWPLMVLAHVLLLLLPCLELCWRGELIAPALFWPSVVLIACCTGLRLWTQWALGAAWNARGVVDPDLGFETRGPYRYLRHPNYLAVGVEVVALLLASSAWISALLLLPLHTIILKRRIRAEDHAMNQLPGYTQAFSHQ